MTEQQAIAVTDTDINADVIVLAGATTGRVFQVIGGENTAPKYLAILTKLLDATNPATGMPYAHNIRNVVLSADGFPMTTDGTMNMGQALYMANTIMINLVAHLEEAMDVVKKQDNELSLRGHIWYNMLMTAAHEMMHMVKYHDLMMAGKIDELLKNDHDEEAIENLARAAVIELAKTVDVEIPALDDWPWAEGRIIDFEKSFHGGQDGWKAQQSKLLGDGTAEGHTVWASLQVDQSCKTMFDYLLAVSEEDPKTWPTERQSLILNEVKVKPIMATTEEEQKAKAEEALAKLISEQQEKYMDGLADEIRTATGREADAKVDPSEISMLLLGRGTTVEAEMTAIEGRIKAETFGEPQVNLNADGSGQGFAPQGGMIMEPDDGFMGGAVDETYGMGFDPGQQFDGSGFSQPSMPSNDAALWNSAPMQTRAPKQPTLPAFMDPSQAGPIMQQIYSTLYQHMFNKCGWAQVQTPQGVTWRFTVPGAIMEPVDLSHIPNVGQFIVAMDTLNERGQYMKRVPLVNGTAVKGLLSKQAGLPEYILYTNHGDGVERIRLFIAQNPDKIKNGSLSQWAQAARAGNRYALLFDKETPIGQPGGMLGSFQNGQWIKANS